MGLLSWLGGKRSFPKHWSDVRSFSVVIPFSIYDLPSLKDTVEQAHKLRSVLSSHYPFEAAEKVHIILLWERDWWDGMGATEHKALCDFANSCLQCDVISYPEDMLLSERARSRIRNDAINGKALFIDTGTRLTEMDAEKLLLQFINE